MTTETKKFTFSQFIINCIATVLIFPAVILGLSGNWLWLEGWIFGLWFDAMMMSIMIYTYLKDPALLAERAKAPGSDNQKTWDKYLSIVIYLLALAWFVIMPLDAERFKWSPDFPAWLKVVGGVLLIPALYLIYRPTVENTFLSTRVRIQDDRKHHVITTGTYGFVRHPLYLGCSLMTLGASLMMGSIYGLILWLVSLFVLAYRITGEEKMLTEELEGYAEYKQKVKYRLIPLVW